MPRAAFHCRHHAAQDRPQAPANDAARPEAPAGPITATWGPLRAGVRRMVADAGRRAGDHGRKGAAIRAHTKVVARRGASFLGKKNLRVGVPAVFIRR